MLFDFLSFLRKLDPTANYELEALSGGLVNFTYRAKRLPSPNPSRFLGHESLILKYAPPFIAAVGKEAPFSQERQQIEAQAITQLTLPTGSLASIAESTNICIPKLLYHDAEEHVLVLEDLGQLLTLDEYFSNLSQSMATSANEDQETCKRIGLYVGRFFGKLHSPQSLEGAQTSATKNLKNNLVINLVLQHAVLPIRDHLKKYGIANPTMLFARVLEDYNRVDLPGELCFVLGDFTPGSILIGESRDGNQRIGVIDWEFSGAGRGPNGDMAQFLASLHLSLLSAPPDSKHFLLVKSFVEGICTSYSEELSVWLGTTHRVGDITPDDGLRLEILRSALILHGREIVNNAIDRQWPTSACVEKMVKMGTWYLERAGNNVGEMISDQNWRELLKEDHEVIIDLFGI